MFDISDKTFWNISTLDYTLCTAVVFNLLSTFEVTELDPLFSDGHCMLNWSLNTIIRTTTQPQGNANLSHSPPIWSEKQKEYFVKSINLEKVTSLNEKLLNTTQTTANVNDITNYTGDIITEAACKASPQTPRPFIKRKL